ncbi:MAG: hypothetical protein V7709_04060 [Halioglobus sp.]
MTAIDLIKHPIHLGLGASSIIQPQFTGLMDWYMDYGARHEKDGIEGRLVSMHTFSDHWDSWEMHPQGSEIVLCTAGSMTLHQEAADGSVTKTTLEPGQYAINEPGIWHTADVGGQATAVFITAGTGTENRPR